jgi:hypothetical protein
MLSREANAEEVSWTVSQWLEPKEIEQAFGVSAPRNPWPPLPHQPSPYAGRLRTGFKVALAALVFLALVTIFFSGGPTLYKTNFPVDLDGREHSTTLGPVTLTRPYQLVSIRANAPRIDNGWIDLDYALVDRRTQTSYTAYGLAERYSGSDSEGYWTEGSGSSTVKLAAVPAGTYDLVVDYTANRWQGAQSSYSYAQDVSGGVTIEVSRGSVFASNFVLAGILILAPFLFFLWRHIKFESARQAESDIGGSAFASDDDDEGDE